MIDFVLLGFLATSLVMSPIGEEGHWSDKKAQFDEDYMVLIGQTHGRVSQAELLALAEKQFGDDLLLSPVRDLPTEALETLHLAVANIFQEGGGVDLGSRLKSLCNEIEARSQQSSVVATVPQESVKNCVRRTYLSLFNGRLFDQADSFLNSTGLDFPALSLSIHLPSSVPTDQPSVFFPPGAGQSAPVTVQPVNLHDGISFVGVVHPGCGFSKKAMSFIENNSLWFSQHLPSSTLWLSTQWRSHTYRQLSAWNELSGIINISVAYRDNAWPEEMELGVTPVFYLIEDGVVIDKSVGWTGMESAQTLQDMLMKIRLDEVTDLQE